MMRKVDLQNGLSVDKMIRWDNGSFRKYKHLTYFPSITCIYRSKSHLSCCTLPNRCIFLSSYREPMYEQYSVWTSIHHIYSILLCIKLLTRTGLKLH